MMNAAATPLCLEIVFATGPGSSNQKQRRYATWFSTSSCALGPLWGGFSLTSSWLGMKHIWISIFQSLQKVASMKNQSIFEGFCAPEPCCSNLRRGVGMNTTLVSYKSGLAEFPKFLANLTDLSPVSCNGIWSGLCNCARCTTPSQIKSLVMWRGPNETQELPNETQGRGQFSGGRGNIKLKIRMQKDGEIIRDWTYDISYDILWACYSKD